jgi:hypothetical protein
MALIHKVRFKPILEVRQAKKALFGRRSYLNDASYILTVLITDMVGHAPIEDVEGGDPLNLAAIE